MRWPPGQWISTTSAERICRFSDVGVRASRTAQRLPSLSLISRTYIHCAGLLEERLQTSNIFAREPKSTLDGIKTKNTQKQHPTTHHYCCVGGIAREFMDRLNPDCSLRSVARPRRGLSERSMARNRKGGSALCLHVRTYGTRFSPLQGARIPQAIGGSFDGA